MKSIHRLGIVLGSVLLSSVAFAKTSPDVAPIVPLPKASRIADSVVVTPQGNAPAAAPVAPAAVPVAAAPVEEVPARQTTVVREDHNYMATIAVSAIMGAVAGALIGGAIYYLGNQEHAARIGYWAGGGVLVGAAVGVTQVMVESRTDTVATRFQTDPVPTRRLALLKLNF